MLQIEGLEQLKVRNYAKKSTINGVFAVNATENSVDMQLYDEIGYFGVTAKAFTSELNKHKGKSVNLAINSVGGDVFDGIAMYNALLAHDGDVNVTIDGLAASAASIVAMAGDRIEIASNAFLMIHNAWSIAIGDKQTMLAMSEVLTKIDSALIATYKKKTHKNEAEITQMLDNETWLNANDAVLHGFVDGVIDESQYNACFDVSIFKNAPSALKRNVENNLRSSGYSKDTARAAVSNGFDILAGRDAPRLTKSRCDADDNSFLTAELNNLANFIKQLT
jgi:ATP-dependent Clp protease, protease subunit